MISSVCFGNDSNINGVIIIDSQIPKNVEKSIAQYLKLRSKLNKEEQVIFTWLSYNNMLNDQATKPLYESNETVTQPDEYVDYIRNNYDYIQSLGNSDQEF